MNSGTTRKPSKGPFVLSILIITVGIGWLLSAQGIGRGIDWVWTMGLGVIGFLTFILSGGCDKLSVVLGPFFLVSSLLSVLRQTGQLNINTEMPILVILMGVLLMIAQSRRIPPPSWFIPFDEHDASPH
ncbi:MAG: hypothetical protein Q8K78_03170 [Planctomycetaceae bacterium]|nr:hypothetical protein [Planctomycetaceae bacterium]